jgi:hypothetical protein
MSLEQHLHEATSRYLVQPKLEFKYIAQGGCLFYKDTQWPPIIKDHAVRDKFMYTVAHTLNWYVPLRFAVKILLEAAEGKRKLSPNEIEWLRQIHILSDVDKMQGA